MFQVLDSDGSGSLSSKEFCEAIGKLVSKYNLSFWFCRLYKPAGAGLHTKNPCVRFRLCQPHIEWVLVDQLACTALIVVSLQIYRRWARSMWFFWLGGYRSLCDMDGNIEEGGFQSVMKNQLTGYIQVNKGCYFCLFLQCTIWWTMPCHQKNYNNN